MSTNATTAAEFPTKLPRRHPARPAPEFPGCHRILLKREELSIWDGRFEYWDGDIVVSEPTSATHEQPSQRLAGLGHVIAGVRGSPIECYGTMDLLLRDERGWKRLAALLSRIDDPDRLAEVGDRIVDCATGAGLLGRVEVADARD